MFSRLYIVAVAASLAASGCQGIENQACNGQVTVTPHPLADFQKLSFELELTNWAPAGTTPLIDQNRLWISGMLMGGAADPAATPSACTVLEDDASTSLDGQGLQLSRGGGNWGKPGCDCAAPQATGDIGLGDPRDGTFRLQDRSESLEISVRNLYARRGFSPSRVDGARAGQRITLQWSVDTDAIDFVSASLNVPSSGANRSGYYHPFADGELSVKGSQLELTLPNDLPSSSVSLDFDLGLKPAISVAGSAQANTVASAGITWRATVPLTVP